METTTTRNVRSAEEDRNHLVLDPGSPCDKTSYMYFGMALFLFVFGALITFFSIDETIQFNELDKIWFFGPLFITSGLMVAVKTLFYLKRKSLIAYVTQQRMQLIVEIPRGHLEDLSTPVQTSIHCQLPSYEATVSADEMPPPSYEEALLVLSTQMTTTKDPIKSSSSLTTSVTRSSSTQAL